MAPRRAAVLRDQPGHDGATLHDHLLAATEQLLEHQPLHELTSRAIARHAGVSDGALYNHFRDKDDLVVGALVRRYGRLVARLEATPLEPHAGLQRNLAAFARTLSAIEADALLLGAGLLADPLLLQRFWTAIHRAPYGVERLRRPLVDYLEAARARGELAGDVDVDAVVLLVFGASAMVALSRRLDHAADRRQLDRQLDAAVAACVRGIARQ